MEGESSGKFDFSAIAVTAVFGALVLLCVMICALRGRSADDDQTEEADNKEEAKPKKPQQQQKKKSVNTLTKKEGKFVFTHPWLVTTLKGHTAPVLCFDLSSNGKYLLSCTEDRSVMLWNIKDLTQKDHKSNRGNVEFDYVTKVCFSPDCKAFIGSLYTANTIRVFKLNKKDDGSGFAVTKAFDFKQLDNDEIANIGIATNGKFIMTSYKKVTVIRIWDLKGQELASINTNQMSNSHVAISPCGRFVASSGFTPDVKVWAVIFDKTGNFKDVRRAFELKGHSSGVHHFDFSASTTRMASVSKDNTWRLYETDIDYEKQQDPRFFVSGVLIHAGLSRLALSPNGLTVAIATGATITLFSGLSGQLERSIEDVHSCVISNLSFDHSGKFLISAGDKYIQILHNVPGYAHIIDDLQDKKLKAKTSAMTERLQNQIKEARLALSVFKE